MLSGCRMAKKILEDTNIVSAMTNSSSSNNFFFWTLRSVTKNNTSLEMLSLFELSQSIPCAGQHRQMSHLGAMPVDVSGVFLRGDGGLMSC